MSETWTEIDSGLRDSGSPVSSALINRYWKRDEALREQHSTIPQLNGTSSAASWTTLHFIYVWVPTWAVTINVEISSFLDTLAAKIRGGWFGAYSDELTITWTSPQTDTLSSTADNHGSRQTYTIQVDSATGSVVDITTLRLWWSQ